MSTEIRIVALDLDGTLLNSDKHLTDRNRRTLARVAGKGVLVVPTTGRFFGMMPPEIRELEFVRYAITVNGAQVYDRETNTALARAEIPLGMALEIMRNLDDFDVIYDCYRNNWGWMTRSHQDKATRYATNEHYLRMVREFRHGVADLKAHLLNTAREGDVQKIMLFAPLTDASSLAAIRAMVAARFPTITVTSSTWNNLELNIASANKGQALKCFAERLGFTLANCVAFGDGMNDLSMIEAAGVGVAMSNAEEAVRRAATFVTCSNDEDGVAVALDRIVPG